mgnify:CR=1 FL=1|jgi:hypothetical protein|tara:strand:+ start:1103 stop:1414 length:312 start_codon:yes stop_codon:yes gene_type:complete
MKKNISKKDIKQLKEKVRQASIQSDAVEMDSWIPSDGLLNAGTGTFSVDSDMGGTYSFGDIGQLDLFSEDDMKEKYPALKQAWEHYQSVLEVCQAKEKEEDEN